MDTFWRSEEVCDNLSTLRQDAELVSADLMSVTHQEPEAATPADSQNLQVESETLRAGTLQSVAMLLAHYHVSQGHGPKCCGPNDCGHKKPGDLHYDPSPHHPLGAVDVTVTPLHLLETESNFVFRVLRYTTKVTKKHNANPLFLPCAPGLLGKDKAGA